MFNGPSAMGKERLDDECKDRHDKDLEVEGEDWRFVEHEVVAKVGDSVVVRRVTHQRRVERVEDPYYADLVRQMETGAVGRVNLIKVYYATTGVPAPCNAMDPLGNGRSICRPAKRTCRRDCVHETDMGLGRIEWSPRKE